VKFLATPLAGACVIETEALADERGAFTRTFCAAEFEAHGLESRLAQASISYNAKRATLRGMHFQVRPHEESKVVSCLRGAIYDVALDLREGSPTRLKWHAVELSARNRRMLYIPAGFAHGFLTLQDDTEVHYHISEFYHPESSRGVRWDDPAFGIEWPEPPQVISGRDRGYPDFRG
jgi:dTDP-4-dehydrorhamnose 3,5-epimerase